MIKMLKEPKGVMVALVTPFTREKRLDKEGLRELVGYLIDSGVHALVPNAGTSEAVSLSDEEYKKVLDIVIDTANGRTPVVSGILKPGIQSAIESAKFCKDAGADAIMLVTPYYNRPTQEGVYDYFKTVAGTVDIPIILYNIPARTGVNINPKTLSQLSEISQVVGVKECNREIGQFMEKIRLVGEKISVLSGEDDIAVEEMAMGAKGAILASANLLPKAWMRIYEACEKGDFKTARKLHRRYIPLFNILFSEHNPSPLKAALNMTGKPGGYVRSPILPIREDTRKNLQEALKSLNML